MCRHVPVARLEHHVPAGGGVPPEAHRGVCGAEHRGVSGDAAIAVQQGRALLLLCRAALHLQLEHAV